MKLRRTSAFYWQVSVSVLFMFWGILVIATKHISRAGFVSFSGTSAQVIGGIVFLIGLYPFCYLLFRAEKDELAKQGFRDLGQISMEIRGIPLEFSIVSGSYCLDRSRIPTAEFVISIPVSGFVPMDFQIRRIGRLAAFATKLRGRRMTSVCLGGYQARTSDFAFLEAFARSDAAARVRRFDESRVAIRIRRGDLLLVAEELKYVEGPYDENTRLFDPHRGRIEEIGAELVLIAEGIREASNQALQTTPVTRSGI